MDYLNGFSQVKELLEQQKDLVCITAVTIYEVNTGLNRAKRKKSEKKYHELKKNWLDFISGMEILSIKAKDAENASKIFDDLSLREKL